MSSSSKKWLNPNRTVPPGNVPNVVWAEGAQCIPLLVIIPNSEERRWAISPLSLSKKLIDSYIPKFPEHDLKHNHELLIKNNFDILFEDEVYNQSKFYDMGALVYYAKVMEWEFPGFSVDTHFENLCKLHAELNENGYISGIEHRFIFVAKKI